MKKPIPQRSDRDRVIELLCKELLHKQRPDYSEEQLQAEFDRIVNHLVEYGQQLRLEKINEYQKAQKKVL
jgi:hypothetical protein